VGGHRRRHGRNRVATAVARAARRRTANPRRERIRPGRSPLVPSVVRDGPHSNPRTKTGGCQLMTVALTFRLLTEEVNNA